MSGHTCVEHLGGTVKEDGERDGWGERERIVTNFYDTTGACIRITYRQQSVGVGDAKHDSVEEWRYEINCKTRTKYDETFEVSNWYCPCVD